MTNSERPEECDLTEPFELHGKWWRAQNDESHAVLGCLSYTPQYGVQLQLYDSLPHKTGFLNLLGYEDGTIWGSVSAFAGRRVPVSLFDPINTNRPNDPGVNAIPESHDIYHVNSALVGVHAHTKDEVLVAEVEFSVVDLEAFTGIQSVKVLLDETGLSGLTILPVEPIELTIRDHGIRISIHSLDRYTRNRSDRTHSFNYRHVIVLNTKQQKTFPEFLKLISQLGNFLTPCSRKAIVFRRIRAIQPAGNIVAWLARSTNKPTRRSDNGWTLTLNEIGIPAFGDALNRWLTHESKLGFISNVLFGELTAPSPYNDARFFHFASCLEGIHRSLVKPGLGKYLPDDQYKQICESIEKSIAASLPEELQTAIKMAVRRANNHFYAQRLDELFNSLTPKSQAMLAEEPQRFLSALKHSRNKLAHVDDTSNSETFEGVQYAHANASIHAWIVIVLLKLCGIPEETVTSKAAFSELLPWDAFRFEKPEENSQK